MRFLDSQLLWLIPAALIFVCILAGFAAQRRKKALTLLLGNGAEDPAAVRLSRPKRIFRLLLLAGTMVCLAVAAARPFFSSELISYKPQGRDVLILFDVSRSMLSTDVAPSRLEHAKFLVRQLIGRESSDRFGFVAFAGHAYLLCPLTADRVALEEYIRELAPGIVPVGGTNIELAITTALSAAQKGAAGSTAFLLITDGDELSGDAVKAAREMAARRIPLFVAGLGDPNTATPVPGEDGSFMRLKNGELVTSRLNEGKLRELAGITNGAYIRSTVTDTGLALLERKIEQLGQSEREESGTRFIPVEEFPFFLTAAAVFFFLYLLLGERPFARHVGMLLLLFLTLGAAAPEETLPAPQDTIPEKPLELYNFALERQKKGAGEFDPLYEKVIQDAEGNEDLRKRSYHNLAAAAQSLSNEEFTKAKQELSQEALDQALTTLGEAEKKFAAAEELYSRSLALPGAAPTGKNLRKMIVDHKELRKLKKKIEELKKQQQQAQQQTQQARQQNQQQQQNAGDSISQARQSAEELEKKAEELNQQQMRDQAQKAKEELKKAGQAHRRNRPEETQKHLDQAARELGGDEKQQQPDGESSDRQQENTPGEEQETQPQPRPTEDEQQEKVDGSTSQRLLQMMQQEEQELRDKLNKDIRARERRVEKDW